MMPCAECRAAVDRQLKLTYQENKVLRDSLDHQNQAITAALSAMDRGEYGSVRRILKTGRDAPPKPTTGVIAKDGAGA